MEFQIPPTLYPNSDKTAEASRETLRPFLYPDTTKLWLNNNILVCWENTGFNVEKTWVQTIISTEYGADC